MADQYISLDGGAVNKGMSKPSKKWQVVCSIALALGLCIGMKICFSWELDQANADLQAQAISVAEQMELMMTDPKHVKDANLLAGVLKSAALDQNADRSLRTQAKGIERQMQELMADPNFVQQAKHVAGHVKAVMDSPLVQEKMSPFTEHMKTVAANSPVKRHKLLGRRLSSVPVKGLVSRPTMASVPKVANTFQPLRGSRTSTIAKASDAGGTALLSSLQKLRIATALADAGLLSAAEQGGLFTKLEKAGAFSTAESLLPLVDQLGLLQFAQGAIDSKPGDIAAQGTALLGIGPVYAALVASGTLPAPEGPLLPAAGVLFTGTTGAGVLLIVLSNLVKVLQAGKPIEVAGGGDFGAAPASAPRKPPAPPPTMAEMYPEVVGFFREAFPAKIDKEQVLGEVGTFGGKSNFYTDGGEVGWLGDTAPAPAPAPAKKGKAPATPPKMNEMYDEEDFWSKANPAALDPELNMGEIGLFGDKRKFYKR